MAEGFLQFPELGKLRDEGLSLRQLYTRLLEIRKVSEWLVVYVYVHDYVYVYAYVYLYVYAYVYAYLYVFAFFYKI